ncbi:hypothetical protein FOVG_17187 [Fusarium oxysporum f. sp. pisi HDV247]|uniref:Uncharacterized protein n=1 Tax=Fusarium oxysporum f. sp. pisi HDV247 TaxID=1080344 RepID=W9NL69_FUSOX|nr:hypothetical protein FOVG_17187 [Fusarium oxysporum f. sp. pisi HDV247]
MMLCLLKVNTAHGRNWSPQSMLGQHLEVMPSQSSPLW